MTLWLVAGDPDPLAGRQQRADHPGAGVGLARARRALDGERRVVEREREPSGRVEVRSRRRGWSASSSHCPTRGGRPKSRSRAGAVRPGRLDPVVGDPLPRSNSDA